MSKIENTTNNKIWFLSLYHNRNPKVPNDFYPSGAVPPKPAKIFGTMTPSSGQKVPIQGELIVNKPSAPFSFVSESVLYRFAYVCNFLMLQLTDNMQTYPFSPLSPP